MNNRQSSIRPSNDLEEAMQRREQAEQAMQSMEEGTPVYDMEHMPRFDSSLSSRARVEDDTVDSTGESEISSERASQTLSERSRGRHPGMSSDRNDLEGYTAEIDTIPDHVQEAKQKASLSNRVDLDQLRSALSSSGVACLEGVLSYMREMGPDKSFVGSEAEKRGARIQYGYWSTLDTLFNRLDNKDFNILFRALLELYDEHQHKDQVFHDDKVFRFVEYWPMSESQSAAFRRLSNMIMVTKDVKTRYHAARQLDWKYVLEYGLTTQGRNRIRNFYEL